MYAVFVCSVAFLDIKVSIEGKTYALDSLQAYRFSQLFVVLIFTSIACQESIPYSQLLRLRRLWTDDSDFSNKSEKMCQFFETRGYPTSVVETGHQRAQQIDRQSTLQTSQKEKNDRIPFTLTFYPHNHAVKSIVHKNSKLLQNDPKIVESFRNLHSFHSNATKTWATFLSEAHF